MRAIKWMVLAAALSVSASAAQVAGTTTVDQVVATVDKEAILLSDVLAEIGPQIGEIKRKSANEDEFNKALQKQIHATLEQAIENKVLLKQAQSGGVSVDDDAVNRRLEDYKKLYPSNDEFMKDLQTTGQTLTELKDRLRKQMLARTLATQKMKEFEGGVTVAESDVMKYYKEHPSEFQHPERVHVYQVFLPAGKDAQTRATVKARLEQLRSEIESGSDFEEIAAQYSQAPGAKDGGLIGWVARGDLVHALEDAAFALKPSDLSGIVETDGGFHLLKIDKKEAAGIAPLEDVRKQVEPKLRADAAETHFKKWLEDLKRRSSVQVFI